MKCSKCKHLLEKTWSFCPYCGTESLPNYFVDERDGERYRIVKIGCQIWMAENFRYKCDGAHSYKYGDDVFVKEYGLLYSWNVAEKIAPDGWHLPSYEEFCQLEEYVKDSNKLKKEHVWKTSLDDPFGFGALPAGCCAQGHDFGLGKFASFWTSSGEVSNSRECRFEIGNMDYDELGDSAVTSASIRFVKDE